MSLLLHLLLIFTPNSGLAYDGTSCTKRPPFEMTCVFEGRSDLRLFDHLPPLHNIQRKLYRRNGAFGSIALIKNGTMSSITYKNCWTLSSENRIQNYIFCDNTDSSEIPIQILDLL